MMQTRRRNEHGAMAIITAAAATMLLLLGALGVDLGNAMNRKKGTQTNADFAALAGGDGLPSTASTTTQLVADWLNKNKPTSDGTANCNPDAGATITVGMLTDGNLINGEVTYPDTNHVKVVSPAARVEYGLANIIGVKNGCVQGTATVRIASSALGMMPYYVTSSCSSGPQTIKSDAGGPSIPFTVPVLFADSDTNNSVLSTTSPNPNPSIISLQPTPGPDGPTITLTGTNLNAANIDLVGFFSSDQTAPKTAAPVTFTGGNTLTVKVPNAVASYQDVWWIRVHRISDQQVVDPDRGAFLPGRRRHPLVRPQLEQRQLRLDQLPLGRQRPLRPDELHPAGPEVARDPSEVAQRRAARGQRVRQHGGSRRHQHLGDASAQHQLRAVGDGAEGQAGVRRVPRQHQRPADGRHRLRLHGGGPTDPRFPR